METQKSKRSAFSGKIGFVLSAAGASVGLGNIWRFPFETGNHGGAAFIFVYLVCVLILGIPIMIAEFLIGRRSRANTARAYQKLAPGTHWRWVGRMGVLAGFLILGYYSVVAGWTLEFIGEAATNSFAGKSAADFIASFNSFVSNPPQALPDRLKSQRYQHQCCARKERQPPFSGNQVRHTLG